MQLVQFSTMDELRLNGLLAEAAGDVTVIHIHGKGGNFYENSFVRRMYTEYPQWGINFLGFNNRGHSSYVEAYKGEQVSYVGSAVERFEECLLDLEAAIIFARSLGPYVVLQGHSFGCEKIMFYGQMKDSSLPLVLLSPCDGYRLQTVWRPGETVEDQIERLRTQDTLHGLEFLPPDEYGIRAGGVDYSVPITARALVDLMAGPAFQLLRSGVNFNGPEINNRCFTYLGAKDALQIDGAQVMSDLISSRIRDPHIEIYPDGDHQLRGAMPQIFGSLATWITADLDDSPV